MSNYEFNLRDYARIFHKRKFLVIFAVLAGLACSIYLFPDPPPVFRSSATVKIEERKTFAGLLSEWMVYNPGDLMASQTKIIKGFPIMKKTALRLKLIDDDSSTAEIHRVVKNLQNNLVTERDGQTNIIKITASSESAREAKDLAATVAEVYVEENLLEKTEEARSTRLFIEEQLALLEDRLKEAEDRLKAFEEEKGEMADIKIDIGKIMPLHQKIMDFKLQLATLEQRYTGKHPKVIAVKQQIKDTESRLEIEKDNRASPKDESSAQKLEHSRLSREVEVNKKLYMMFKEKLEEARINEAQKVGDVSIVDPAVLPDSPVNTQDNMNVIMIGGIMGLLLGIGCAFILESMDTSIGTIDDIERVMKLPVLGVIASAQKEIDKKYLKKMGKTFHVSKSEAQEIYIRMITHHEPKSLIAESCRNVRTNLRLGPSKKVILITSAGTQEGKTTVLINLGLSVAQTGAKTLLISTDLRRPAIAKTFRLKREPGLTDLLAETVSFNDASRNISDLILGDTALGEITKAPGLENLTILPCGKLPHNPAEILESKEWTDLLQELRQRFDFIFLDTPPVLPVADASIIASQVDSVVLCYEIGRISRDALLRTKTQIESVGAHISGVVLNQIKSQARALEPYPYYTNYRYRYYGEDRPARKKMRAKRNEEVYPTEL
jgi:tyrosine-protein kinase Etk/Wzc